jgi:hypothetical protein
MQTREKTFQPDTGRFAARVVIQNQPIVRTATQALLGALIAGLLFSVDPADSTWGASGLKYTPVLLSLLAAFVYRVGLRGIPYRDRTFLASLTFGVLVLGGGVYTVTAMGAPPGLSFSGRGLGALCIIAGYALGFLPRERRYVETRFIPLLLGAGVIMTILLVFWRAGYRFAPRTQIFHEDAVWLTAAVGAAICQRGAFRRFGLVAIFCAGAFLTLKITGFAFTAISLAALAAVERARRRRSRVRTVALRRLVIFQASLFAVIASLAGGLAFRTLLPKGSTNVRVPAYWGRWEEFVDSPLWGQFFVGSPIVEIGRLRIPSHSDLLDILAFGGVLSMALFLFPVLTALWHGVRSLPQYVQSGRRLETAATVFAVAFLFELSFNPVIGQPKLALFFWTSIGLLLADRVIFFAPRSQMPPPAPPHR